MVRAFTSVAKMIVASAIAIGSGAGCAREATTRPIVSLTEDAWEFSGDVPESLGTFRGHRIRVAIDRTPELEDPLSERDVVLMNTIVRDLPLVIRRADSAFVGFANAYDSTAIRHASNPQIWIVGEPDTIDEWHFVVERDDDDDFGYHIEFSGLHQRHTWSGD